MNTNILPYCLENGVEYYVYFKDNKAIVNCHIVEENDNYFLTKENLREMSLTAKIKGIETVVLYTNYGLELHSKYENAKTIGFDTIYKDRYDEGEDIKTKTYYNNK